jgi:hypothetical protein
MRDIPLNDVQDLLRAVTRRHFFRQAGFGIGGAALSLLLNRGLFAADLAAAKEPSPADAVNPLAPRHPHYPPKAKSIIYLFMAGAPSQLDLLDFKPKLQEWDGQNCPEEILKGERFAFIKGVPRLLGSPYAFAFDFRAPAPSPRNRRRRLHRAVSRHYAVQPCARPDFHEHGASDHRPPKHGLVAHLRIGERVQ